MRPVVDLISTMVSADPDLPDEFSGPVAYQPLWGWLVLIAGLVLLGAVGVVLLATRSRPEGILAGDTIRDEHVGRLDQIADAVESGTISARSGHQQLSATLRSFVQAVTPVPATVMGLEDFRELAPEVFPAVSGAELTETIALLYPPEFAPDGEAETRFAQAHARCRDLVSTWK